MTETRRAGKADETKRHRNHRAVWTLADITFVEQHYGQLSAVEIGEKLGRTASAIIRQASLLGVTERGSWSSAEKDFLKKHYGNLPTKKIASRLGRSVSAVRAAVVKLDLGTWKNRPWTEMEQALMQEHYSEGIDEINVLLPGRTREAIFAQACKMGLTETRFWQPDEDRVLRALYPEFGVAKVREMLPHRTIPAIKHRVTYLRLRFLKRKKR